MRKLIERTLQKMEKSQQHKKEVVKYLEINYPELLGNRSKKAQIKECWNILSFRRYANGETKLHTGNFCKYDKMCIACATRRAILQIQKFEQGIKDNGLENMFWYHIIPTIKHNKYQTLEEVLGNLWNAKEKLASDYRNSQRAEHKSKSFFSQFTWMIISVEISYGENWFHPHLHILACAENPLTTERSNFMKTYSNRELQKERYKYTDWLGLNIGMKSIGVQKNHFNRKGVGEVFKYVVKNSQLKAPQLAELLLLQEKRRYRFLSTYGVCRGRRQRTKGKEPTDLQKVYVYENEKYWVLS